MGLLLGLRCERTGDLFFRRISTGEWLGSRFHRSLWLREWLLKLPLPRRERERDLDRLDLFPLGDRDLERFLFGDRDLERLLRVRELERDDRFLREGVRDLDRDDRFLREGVLDLDRDDRFLREGVLDFDRDDRFLGFGLLDLDFFFFSFLEVDFPSGFKSDLSPSPGGRGFDCGEAEPFRSPFSSGGSPASWEEATVGSSEPPGSSDCCAPIPVPGGGRSANRSNTSRGSALSGRGV